MRWVNTSTGIVGLCRRNCRRMLTPSSFGRFKSRRVQIQNDQRVMEFVCGRPCQFAIGTQIRLVVFCFQSLADKLARATSSSAIRNPHKVALIEMVDSS
jgi:hypothetical protein